MKRFGLIFDVLIVIVAVAALLSSVGMVGPIVH
jgi:hypothetical protein